MGGKKREDSMATNPPEKLRQDILQLTENITEKIENGSLDPKMLNTAMNEREHLFEELRQKDDLDAREMTAFANSLAELDETISNWCTSQQDAILTHFKQHLRHRRAAPTDGSGSIILQNA